MDITQGETTLHGDADQARRHVGHMAESARHGLRQAGYKVNSFVHWRPIETALLSAAAACLITGLAFWLNLRIESRRAAVTAYSIVAHVS